MALCALALLLRHPDTVSWPRRCIAAGRTMNILLMYARGFRMAGFSPSPPRFSPLVIGMLLTLRFAAVSPARYWAFCCGMPLTGCLMSPYLSALWLVTEQRWMHGYIFQGSFCGGDDAGKHGYRVDWLLRGRDRRSAAGLGPSTAWQSYCRWPLRCICLRVG